jgi:hypothetical protein
MTGHMQTGQLALPMPRLYKILMRYVHSVYFTCRPGTSAGDIDAQIADAENLLGRIHSVRLVRSGKRDLKQQRDVNATDYDIGLTVLFDDAAGLQTYADHPLHLEYLARYKKHWDRVRVYDFES